MTARDQDKTERERVKLTEEVERVGREQGEVEGKMERVFGEWRVVAEQAKVLIERHEEERERMLAELEGEYLRAVLASDGDTGGTVIPRSRLSTNNSTSHLSATGTRSAYSTSLDRLSPLLSASATTTTKPTPPAYLPALHALYDYQGQSEEELSFRQGDFIELVDREEDPWWRGRCRGKVGLFPSNFVQLK
jgi:hypothetical protein